MDYALAVDILLPAADYRRADDYASLVATWHDARPVPSDAALVAAWENYATPLPESVSNLAFTESLIEHDIFPDAVETLIDLIADEKQRWLAKVRWQQSRIALSDPILQAQAAAFGLTPAKLDAIYARAVEIEQG